LSSLYVHRLRVCHPPPPIRDSLRPPQRTYSREGHPREVFAQERFRTFFLSVCLFLSVSKTVFLCNAQDCPSGAVHTIPFLCAKHTPRMGALGPVGCVQAPLSSVVSPALSRTFRHVSGVLLTRISKISSVHLSLYTYSPSPKRHMTLSPVYLSPPPSLLPLVST